MAQEKDESNCGQVEEITEVVDSSYQNIIPEKSKANLRNFLGFWLLGLCNNYPYVIMLSAAFDLLNPEHHGGEKQGGANITTCYEPTVGNNTSVYNGTKCNALSTGAILLADILPSLFIKMVSPFIPIKTHMRVLISVVLCAMSFLITSLSFSHWLTFLGVVCAALSSGLGEVTFLSYTSFFDKDVISAWSSGTGGAGVFGALSYASLRTFFHIRPTLQIMLVMPILTVITFWILLDHPPSLKGKCQDYFCSAEMKPMLGHDIDLSTKDYVGGYRIYTFQDKLTLIKPLLKYMIPLGLVYFAEYFINQGLMELIYFPNVCSWLSHDEQYRWYQVDYQVGVLISRSSIKLLQIKRLWILPILQGINMVILLFHVCFSYIPSIWIVLAIIFYEGLLGGSAYVNTFYRISSEINENDKEFSMGVASLGDSIGISVAGIVALPVHDALCKLSSYSI